MSFGGGGIIRVCGWVGVFIFPSYPPLFCFFSSLRVPRLLLPSPLSQSRRRRTDTLLVPPVYLYLRRDPTDPSQDFFLLFATPFAFLPRATLIALIFTISAIYHALLSYPFTHTPVLTPWLILFTGSGVACVLERSFYHITGRKVGGWWGRFWTWRIMYLLSAPIVEHEFSMGIATDAPARE